MSAAVTALSWELLARHRWVLSLSGLGLVFLCVLGLLLPESARTTGVSLSLTMPVAGLLLLVMAALLHEYEGPIESTASLYPVRLFTLPVPTVVLVAPPLLLGTALMIVCWLACAVCMLRTFGADVPLWWPGLFGAAALALVQAFVWSPFPLPWLRPVALMIFIAGLFAGGILFFGEKVAGEVSEPLLVLMSAALLLAGYGWALAGVTRARRGVGVREPFQVGAVAVAANREAPPPFSSPLRAQLWLQGRRHRWGFLFIVLLCLGVAVSSMVMVDIVARDVYQTGVVKAVPSLNRAVEMVGPSWLVIGYVVIVPLMMVLFGGGQIGRLTTDKGSHGFSAFLATRPIRTEEMVKAKLLICAGGVIGLWTVMAAACLAWAVSMGRIHEMTDRLTTLTGSGAAALFALVVGLVLLVTISWLVMIENLWAGALGRQWVEVIPIVVGVGLWWGVALLVHGWREEWRPVISGVVGAALLGKTLAVCWVVRQLRRERLMTVRALAVAIAGWVLLTAVVVGVSLWLFAGELLLAAGVVLMLLPLARPLAAPLTLARNRTR